MGVGGSHEYRVCHAIPSYAASGSDLLLGEESHKNQPRLTGSESPELGFQNIGDAASKAKNEMHWEDIFDIFCHGQISMIWGGQLRI